MKVDLTSDAVDGILHSILLQDYTNLCSDINNLESAKELRDYQKQDLEHNYRYRNAMEIMMEYYIGFDWKEKLNGTN